MSALDSMVAEGKTTTVQTLPPDGTILEEVITEMRERYGPPTTPQEFRLLIRIPGAEIEIPRTEPEDPEEVDVGEEAAAMAEEAGVEGAGARRARRRRRRRRGGWRPGAGGDGSGTQSPVSEEGTSEGATGLDEFPDGDQEIEQGPEIV